MHNWRIGAAAAALLIMTTIVSVAAQRSIDDGVAISDETIAKAGAALRRVTEITSTYSPKVAVAATPDERVHFINEELIAATTAVNDQGLSVDQYNNVIEVAQSDPGVRERLLRATNRAD
jgi:hypothetical protein